MPKSPFQGFFPLPVHPAFSALRVFFFLSHPIQKKEDKAGILIILLLRLSRSCGTYQHYLGYYWGRWRRTTSKPKHVSFIHPNSRRPKPISSRPVTQEHAPSLVIRHCPISPWTNLWKSLMRPVCGSHLISYRWAVHSAGSILKDGGQTWAGWLNMSNRSISGRAGDISWPSRSSLKKGIVQESSDCCNRPTSASSPSCTPRP